MNNNTNEVKTKACSKCREEKHLTLENFYARKTNKDGFQGQCRDCQNAYYRKRVANNKEHFQEYHRRYNEENKERILRQKREYAKNRYRENKGYYDNYYIANKKRIQEFQSDYWKENKEHLQEYNKKHYIENKERYRELNAEWRENNKDKIRKYRLENRERISYMTRKHKKEHADKYRLNEQKRLAKKKKLPHTLTNKQWIKIKSNFNHSCSYCGITESEHLEGHNEHLHQDHFIPLSKNGEYTHNNIIPACRSCNSSKGDRNFFEWYPIHKHYCKKRESAILKFLGYRNKQQQLSIL